MTVTYAYAEQPSKGHPLRPNASPRTIRTALLPADRIRFDAAYEAALVEARERLELTGLFRMLEHWRRVAVLQSDPEGYRRMVRRAAEALTGEEIPAEALRSAHVMVCGLPSGCGRGCAGPARRIPVPGS